MKSETDTWTAAFEASMTRLRTLHNEWVWGDEKTSREAWAEIYGEHVPYQKVQYIR